MSGRWRFFYLIELNKSYMNQIKISLINRMYYKKKIVRDLLFLNTAYIVRSTVIL